MKEKVTTFKNWERSMNRNISKQLKEYKNIKKIMGGKSRV